MTHDVVGATMLSL